MSAHRASNTAVPPHPEPALITDEYDGAAHSDLLST